MVQKYTSYPDFPPVPEDVDWEGSLKWVLSDDYDALESELESNKAQLEELQAAVGWQQKKSVMDDALAALLAAYRAYLATKGEAK